MEPVPGPQLPATVVLMVTYGELHPRSSRVPICLCNLSSHTMGYSHKCSWLDRLSHANQVPLVVHPTRTPEESNPEPQKGWLLEALDLQGLQEWLESEQKQATELLHQMGVPVCMQ